MKFNRCLATIAYSLGLTGCAVHPVLPLAEKVEIDRFMGRWFVIAHIPTWLEAQSYNAIESYSLNADGSIATTFTFNEGSFNGPFKSYHPKGFVVPDTNNALWGMQFVWPIKAQYKISYLAEDYSSTIIARDKLDYVWIMARQPQISEAEYTVLIQKVADFGYDISKLRRVPHASQEVPAPDPQ